MRNKALYFLMFFSSIGSSNTLVITEPSGREHRTGLVIPEDYFKTAPRAEFTEAELSDLPDTFNAPESPVKDQGQCGSCSHFASTGVYESLLLAKQNQTYDLSEQNLLDCAKYDNYKCSGSFEHFKYLIEAGQAAEASFPYRARAGSCKKFTPAAEKPVSWGVVGAAVRATEAEVRAGLNKYGAMWITVSANNAWGQPGAVRRCSSGGQTNHAVVVVGYKPDDKRAGHYLFHIRNSWGKTWNGDGHVYMNLGCDSLGETVSFLELAK